MRKVRVLRWIMWTYDQLPSLHQGYWFGGLEKKLAQLMRLLRRQSVCVMVKTDEVRILHIPPIGMLRKLFILLCIDQYSLSSTSLCFTVRRKCLPETRSLLRRGGRYTI